MAELGALGFALFYMKAHLADSLVICSDSLSAIEALQVTSAKDQLGRNLVEKDNEIEQRGKDVIFYG